jgi:hypothetical protein
MHRVRIAPIVQIDQRVQTFQMVLVVETVSISQIVQRVRRVRRVQMLRTAEISRKWPAAVLDAVRGSPMSDVGCRK